MHGSDKKDAYTSMRQETGNSNKGKTSWQWKRNKNIPLCSTSTGTAPTSANNGSAVLKANTVLLKQDMMFYLSFDRGKAFQE
jgi:hypothetical protein